MSKLTDNLHKLARYRRQYGLGTALYYAMNQILYGSADDYPRWLKRHAVTESELVAQRATHFEREPLISVVIPLYKTPVKYLDALVESFQAQTYSKWELCLSNGSGTTSEDELTTRLAELTAADSRIRVVTSERPLGISENTNQALAIATGEYIGFADHDDQLAPNALYEYVQFINEHPEAQLIYCDEDKVDASGRRYFKPHFKPDFNPDMLRSTNYICHFTVVSRQMYEAVGGLDPELDGSQDYDFILRCTEQTDKICHIPKILYHWRVHGESTAEKPEHKLYAFEAGGRALNQHYERLGIAAKAEVLVHDGVTYWGHYRTRYALEGEPTVSVIRTAGRSAADCNREAEQAGGDYLLFLSGEITSMEPGTQDELLAYCRRDDIGVAGAKIYDPDDRVSHAGIILGVGENGWDEQFRQFRREDPGYFGRAIMAQNISAVTADCLMVSADRFREAGGFGDYDDPALRGADLCLRLSGQGYRHVFVPYAEAHGSVPGKKDGSGTDRKEIEKFQKKWLQDESYEDPCYNPNLTHTGAIYKFDS